MRLNWYFFISHYFKVTKYATTLYFAGWHSYKNILRTDNSIMHTISVSTFKPFYIFFVTDFHIPDTWEWTDDRQYFGYCPFDGMSDLILRRETASRLCQQVTVIPSLTYSNHHVLQVTVIPSLTYSNHHVLLNYKYDLNWMPSIMCMVNLPWWIIINRCLHLLVTNPKTTSQQTKAKCHSNIIKLISETHSQRHLEDGPFNSVEYQQS